MFLLKRLSPPCSVHPTTSSLVARTSPRCTRDCSCRCEMRFLMGGLLQASEKGVAVTKAAASPDLLTLMVKIGLTQLSRSCRLGSCMLSGSERVGCRRGRGGSGRLYYIAFQQACNESASSRGRTSPAFCLGRHVHRALGARLKAGWRSSRTTPLILLAGQGELSFSSPRRELEVQSPSERLNRLHSCSSSPSSTNIQNEVPRCLPPSPARWKHRPQG